MLDHAIDYLTRLLPRMEADGERPNLDIPPRFGVSPSRIPLLAKC